MATFTTIIDKAQWKKKLDNGLEFAVAEVTVGVASDDYSNGIALSANKAKLGFNKIVHVFGAVPRSSNGAALGVTMNYNASTGKLQGFIGNGSAVLTEAAASNFGDGAIIRCVVVGV